MYCATVCCAVRVAWCERNVRLSACVLRAPQALKQMGGALRDKYEAWRTELKGCLAHAEAVIDFGDDEVQYYCWCAYYIALSLLRFCGVPTARTKVDRERTCVSFPSAGKMSKAR